MNRRGASSSHGFNHTFGSSSLSQRAHMRHRATRSANNGGLWFDIDNCINKDIRETCEADFWGQWWNYNMIPKSKKDAWWSSFVQKYYWDNEHQDDVFTCWKHLCEESIKNIVSKRKRPVNKFDNIQETEEMIKKSKTASVETSATPQSISDESDDVSQIGSTATGPSHNQLNAMYLEYHNVDMNNPATTYLHRNLDMDMRMTKMEESLEALKRGMDALLRAHGIDPTTLQPMVPPAAAADDNVSTMGPIT